MMTLSSGPSVDLTVYRLFTSAGSPHRVVLVSSRNAGQFMNIVNCVIAHP